MMYTYLIIGPKTARRLPVSFLPAFTAYATLTPEVDHTREAYFSAFNYGPDFIEHLGRNQGSVAGFSGACFSPFLWIDIDSRESALADTRKIVATIEARYSHSPLVFFSGSKGFHVGISTGLFDPAPAIDFNARCRGVATSLASLAGIQIDEGVYDITRAFRAPNSRHPRTGLHKRHLTAEQINALTIDEIAALARDPFPFTLPSNSTKQQQAVLDWSTITTPPTNTPTEAARTRILNLATRQYIANSAEEGDRHRMLFSAAANLGEIGLTPEQAYAILSEAGLESGLSPKEVRRTIECGIARGRK